VSVAKPQACKNTRYELIATITHVPTNACGFANSQGARWSPATTSSGPSTARGSPNDPRGSSSREIRNAAIAGLGELHHGRKRVQPASGEIRRFYDAARGILKHEPLNFDQETIAVVGASFADLIRANAYTCYACAIMPDHVHVLTRKHRHKAEDMIVSLQDASRAALIEARARPADHPVWGGPGWKVFLEARDDIERTIRYIEDNPVKARLPLQKWGFVVPYDGWLPGVSSIRPR
jgi:REP element-mobilizing transposase RayT